MRYKTSYNLNIYWIAPPPCFEALTKKVVVEERKEMGLPSGRGPVEKCIQDKLYNRKVWKIVLVFLVLLDTH